MTNYYPRKTRNYTQRRNTASQRDGFWATCPQCGHKFATPKAWIFKYLERIGYAISDDEQEPEADEE
jgi:hypothetical protein